MPGVCIVKAASVLLIALGSIQCFFFQNKQPTAMSNPILNINNAPDWENLLNEAKTTNFGRFIVDQEELRSLGQGLPHTNAKYRLFSNGDDSVKTPVTTEVFENEKQKIRVKFYRDTAGWCPYCQKVWILLEEKKIPYEIEKINMRSYGDKPAAFLRVVPNGLLPALQIDNGQIITESLDIMLLLDEIFNDEKIHKPMWPRKDEKVLTRAVPLMRLERELFSHWCSVVFRPSNAQTIKGFESCLKRVDDELKVTNSPWFLDELSIVDLTYITHVERMIASCIYWCNLPIRNCNKYPHIDRWLHAFEELPSYMATKSDFYTHAMDIPPQYGPSYPVRNYELNANKINGNDGISWKLPLPPFSSNDLELVSPTIDPGDEASRVEAAYKLINNKDNIIKFALRGAGQPGAKQFQAPLADPYAIPALEYYDDMDTCLKLVANALLEGHTKVSSSFALTINNDNNSESIRKIKSNLIKSLIYLRDRIGVPRDMSYPAARQFRAHLNWMIDQIEFLP
eukprot:gene4714-6617_t